MADKASIVGTNDKGQFSVSVPKSSIDRVDVIDIDLVLHTKGGERLILPGAALEAMTATPPAIQFSDGTAGADSLLAAVDKVQTPTTSIPAMTSLTEFDQKRTEGKKNRTADGADKAEDAAQQAQAQQVAPLPTDGRESSVDKLIAKAESMEFDMRNKAFDPAPPQIYEPPSAPSDGPGSQPQTAKIPLHMALSLGNVASPYTATDIVTGDKIVYGGGGDTNSNLASKTLTGSARQYSQETLTGGNGADTIYGDAFYSGTAWTVTGSNVLNQSVYGVSGAGTLDKDTGQAPTGSHLYYAKEISLAVAGYIRHIYSVSITGLPAGVYIQGATGTTGGTWSLTESDVISPASTLTVIYDTSAVRAMFNKDSDGDGVNDYVDVEMSVRVTGLGAGPLDETKVFVVRFQDVDSTADITGAAPVELSGEGGGWSSVYVMPTASAPHTIDAGAGNDTIYAGNSADTVSAGTGNDIVLTYAGNDTVIGGAGNDTVWSGGGNDIVIAGADNNTVYGGSGVDTLIGSSGDDTLEGGDGNDILYGGTGTNVLDGGASTNTSTNGSATGDWVSFNGTAGITAGTASIANLLTEAAGELTSVTIDLDTNGNGAATQSAGSATLVSIENIIGTRGNDSIDASDYAVAHTLYGLAGDDVITGGTQADTIYAGAGEDSVLGGGGDDKINLAVTDVTITGSGLTGTTADAAGAGTLTVAVATAGIAETFTDITNYADGGAGADTIIGGAGRDYFHVGLDETLNGSARDTFAGGDGIDTLDLTAFTATGLTVDMVAGTINVSGSAYADFSSVERILTSSGNDAVTGTDGDDSIWTGNGNDTIQVGKGANYVEAGAGNDTIDTDDGASGNDTFYAGDGDDGVWTGRGDDTVWGGIGNDRLYAEYGNDTLYGEAGNDSLWGSATGTDHVLLDGGANSNYYYMNRSMETVAATAGWDMVRYGDSYVIGTAVTGVNYGVFVNLDGSDHSIAYNNLSAAATLDGTAGTSYWWNGSNWTAQMTSTSVTGQTWTWVSANAELGLYGFADHDVYHGVEAVYGTGYSDVLIGNASANNFYASNGNDAMFGLGGNDWFQVNTASGGHTKYIDGGDGVDTLDLSGITSSTPITINLATHTGTHIVYNVESILGGSGDDILTGDANDNTLNGGIGADSMTGGDGNDAYYVNSSSDKVTEDLNRGTDTIYTSINWTLGDHVENLTANSTGNLTLTGNTLDNIITGNSGNDIIDGGGGADSLLGGTGNDTFITTSALVSTVALFNGGGGGDSVVASGWTFSAGSFNNAKWSSVELINVRDGGTGDAYGLNGTDIRSILDNGNSSALTLHLDRGDTFTVSTSDGYSCTVSNTALNTGTALDAGSYTATYKSGATTVAQLTIVVV